MIEPYYQEEDIIIYNNGCLEVLKEIPDESVDLIITDPPYFVTPKGKKNLSRKNMRAKSMRRNMDIILNFGEWDIFESELDYKNFTKEWYSECCRILKQGAWIYVFFAKEKIGYFTLEFNDLFGINTRTVFTWLKKNPTPQFRKVNWLSASEFIFVGSKGSSKIKNYGYIKDMMNYWISCNSSIYGKTDHPTEKPIELISKFIKANTNKGETVLDPFLGSGTTARACKDLGRKCIGIEISESYCKMAIKRLEQEVLNI